MRESKYFIDLLSLKSEMQYRGYSLSTQNTYSKTVEEFLEFVDKDTIDIKREDVIRYLDKKLETVKSNTVLVKLNALQFFFEEILGLNITENIRKYKRIFNTKDFMSLEQFNILVASVQPREQLIYKIVFETGMLIEEIVELELSDIKNTSGHWQLKENMISSELAKEILIYTDRKYIDGKIFDVKGAVIRYWNRENTQNFLGKQYTFKDIRHSIALEKFLKLGREKEAAKYLRNKDVQAIRQYYRRAGYDYNSK